MDSGITKVKKLDLLVGTFPQITQNLLRFKIISFKVLGLISLINKLKYLTVWITNVGPSFIRKINVFNPHVRTITMKQLVLAPFAKKNVNHFQTYEE